MKPSKERPEKFIRILSAPTLAIILLADLAVLFFAGFAIDRLIHAPSILVIIIAVVEVFAIVVSVLVTKQIFSEGLALYSDRFEFSGIDDGGSIVYDEVTDITCEKDTKASLVKNFSDRHTFLTFETKTHDLRTVDIGLVSVRTAESITRELCKRCGVEYKRVNTAPKKNNSAIIDLEPPQESKTEENSDSNNSRLF